MGAEEVSACAPRGGELERPVADAVVAGVPVVVVGVGVVVD